MSAGRAVKRLPASVYVVEDGEGHQVGVLLRIVPGGQEPKSSTWQAYGVMSAGLHSDFQSAVESLGGVWGRPS